MKIVTRIITLQITQIEKNVPDDAEYNNDLTLYRGFAEALKKELNVDDVNVTAVQYFEQYV